MKKDEVKDILRQLLADDPDIRDLVRRIVGSPEEIADADRKEGEWEKMIGWLSRTLLGEEKVGTPSVTKKKIKEKIKNICEESRQRNQQIKDRDDRLSTLSETYTALQAEKDRLSGLLQQEEEKAKVAQEKCAELEGKIDSLEETLSARQGELQASQAETNRLSGSLCRKEEEAKKWQKKYAEQQDAAETYRREAEKEREDAQSLRKELAQAEASLRAHFERGNALFAAYGRLPKEIKDRLARVIHKADEFESFICCLTQEDAMKAFWDMAKEADEKGNEPLRDSLYEMFDYSMALVNHTRRQPYECLSVSKGADFTVSEMDLAGGSQKQGKVREIRLLGFRNTFNGAVERKSVVSL